MDKILQEGNLVPAYEMRDGISTSFVVKPKPSSGYDPGRLSWVFIASVDRLSHKVNDI